MDSGHALDDAARQASAVPRIMLSIMPCIISGSIMPRGIMPSGTTRARPRRAPSCLFHHALSHHAGRRRRLRGRFWPLGRLRLRMVDAVLVIILRKQRRARGEQQKREQVRSDANMFGAIVDLLSVWFSARPAGPRTRADDSQQGKGTRRA